MRIDCIITSSSSVAYDFSSWAQLLYDVWQLLALTFEIADAAEGVDTFAMILPLNWFRRGKISPIFHIHFNWFHFTRYLHLLFSFLNREPNLNPMLWFSLTVTVHRLIVFCILTQRHLSHASCTRQPNAIYYSNFFAERSSFTLLYQTKGKYIPRMSRHFSILFVFWRVKKVHIRSLWH